MSFRFISALPGLVIFLAQPAVALAEDGCAQVAQPWQGAETRTAARNDQEASALPFGPDEGIILRLRPDPEVSYVTLPKGEGEESSFGGLATVRIVKAGRYLVGLSEPAWIDVATDGKPAETRTFGRGPACSGIRKGVSFDLSPGDHVVEVSGNLTDTIGVIVVPQE